MATTPKLALRYPAGTDAPDGPGAFLALATDLDNALAQYDIGNEATLQPGYGWDTGPGLCAVIKFGQLRVVSFSVWNASGFGTNTVVANLKAGNRPAGPLYVGGVAWDNSTSVMATLGLNNLGDLSLVGSIPDVGNDGKVQAIRGTFTFFATH